MHNEISLPPEEYMTLVCGPDIPHLAQTFTDVGKTLAGMLRSYGMLQDRSAFLDVGCGCGRIARWLVEFPIASYTGFDRHTGMIDWCKHEISSRDPRFEFHHFGVKSTYDQVDGEYGTLYAGDFHFPYKGNSFDSALMASVITHMPLLEAGHYLVELKRVLKPEGRLLLSVFLSRNPSHTQPMNFSFNPHEFLEKVQQAGLRLQWRDRIKLLTGIGLNYASEGHNWFLLRRP